MKLTVQEINELKAGDFVHVVYWIIFKGTAKILENENGKRLKIKFSILILQLNINLKAQELGFIIVMILL